MAELLAAAASEAGVSAAIAPAFPDIGSIANRRLLPVLAQHTDDVPPGARTGSVPPEAIRAAGAAGSLVNHSEHPLDVAAAGRVTRRLGELHLAAVVCARTVAESADLASSHPPFLAIEPPELIGGKVSVSAARPELIRGAVEAVARISPETRVLCGAGVHDRADVRKALELGSRGILVASAVATAPNPSRAIAELLAGF